MGMVGVFRRLSGDDLALLMEEPARISDYLGEEELEDFGPFVELDVDKAWHAIHYLLTGSASAGNRPLNFIVIGGTEVGEEDLGYGPARGFTSAEVREIAEALKGLPREALAERFDPAAMTAASIYPEIWDRPLEEDDTRAYVLDYYDTLRAFMLEAAASDEALITYVS